jgi:hypothetical protein
MKLIIDCSACPCILHTKPSAASGFSDWWQPIFIEVHFNNIITLATYILCLYGETLVKSISQLEHYICKTDDSHFNYAIIWKWGFLEAKSHFIWAIL